MKNEKEIRDKVTDVAANVKETVAKTTSELYKRGKLQVELVKLQSDIRETNKKLGAICYSLEKGHTSDDGTKAELVEKLDAINDRICEIESVIEEEKERKEYEKAVREAAKYCAGCGELRVSKMTYCGHCGSKHE